MLTLSSGKTTIQSWELKQKKKQIRQITLLTNMVDPKSIKYIKNSISCLLCDISTTFGN